MKDNTRYTAVVLQEFGPVDGFSYFPGSNITLEKSDKYENAYWVIQGGKQTQALVSNEYGTLFQIKSELKRVS